MQKTAYAIASRLVDSERCIRDRRDRIAIVPAEGRPVGRVAEHEAVSSPGPVAAPYTHLTLPTTPYEEFYASADLTTHTDTDILQTPAAMPYSSNIDTL